ncbi:hypothetical protein [Burkholderia sp. Bp9140]|uniref:hypothetical protein n=1 Tax=Burkholderia sp. Bp9140 TaxID=2184572 RepID=UPI0021AB2848|nr:hypothetical protein [Burkholderia sp. Bp9140]
MLIIFDGMFGTYVEETEPVDYGITQQIRSYNFLVLNLHEFVDMWRDVLAPGTLGRRLRHLWMPPERARPGHRPIHPWTVERNGGKDGVAADAIERGA